METKVVQWRSGSRLRQHHAQQKTACSEFLFKPIENQRVLMLLLPLVVFGQLVVAGCWLLPAARCCLLLAAAGCCWLLSVVCCWLLLAAAGCCWLLLLLMLLLLLLLLLAAVAQVSSSEGQQAAASSAIPSMPKQSSTKISNAKQ